MTEFAWRLQIKKGSSADFKELVFLSVYDERRVKKENLSLL